MSCVQQVELQIFFQTSFHGAQFPFGKEEPTGHPGASAMPLTRLLAKFFIVEGRASMSICHDVCSLGSVFIVGLFFFFCLPYSSFKTSREGNHYPYRNLNF